MYDRRPLDRAEEERCLRFMRLLGVTDPDHHVLGDRGYFSLFIAELKPDDLKDDHGHPGIREFRDIIRLLAMAGPERLKELLRHAGGSEGGIHEEPKADPPSGSLPTRTSDEVNVIAHAVADEHPSGSSVATLPTSPPHARFVKELRPIRPSEEARERLLSLPRAQTVGEAVAFADRYCSLGCFHDAYHILVDYLVKHPLDQHVFEAATGVILKASKFDRDRGHAPFNMLFECEEMAAILQRRIPDIFQLKETGDERTAHLYRYVKMVYMTWTLHCHALLEYKYRVSSREYVRRSTIDPREFGFLLDVMVMAVRSRLPLDLLRLVKVELRKCTDIGMKVIAHTEKRYKFLGDVLRILASPTKDTIPDLCFEYFREITEAYRDEGDRAAAMMFCKQALLIRKTDRDMLRILDELKHHASHGPRD